jgi:hypothetical protein
MSRSICARVWCVVQKLGLQATILACLPHCCALFVGTHALKSALHSLCLGLLAAVHAWHVACACAASAWTAAAACNTMEINRLLCTSYVRDRHACVFLLLLTVTAHWCPCITVTGRSRKGNTHWHEGIKTLTSGLTTNSTETSAIARHLHVTASQRVGGP